MFNQLAVAQSELLYFEEFMDDTRYPNLACQCYGCLQCVEHPLNSEQNLLILLDSVARENGIRLYELCDRIFGVLTRRGGKKNTLIFIGASDSGKSTLVDTLLSHIPNYDVGNFQPPNSRNPSSFWMSDLRDVRFYRCQELHMEDPTTVQTLKLLFEGNENLKTEIKYRSPTMVKPRPIIITMNGHNQNCIWQHCSSEKEAIKNRVHIFVMETPLKARIGVDGIRMMKRGNRHAIAGIYSWYRQQKTARRAQASREHAEFAARSDQDAEAIMSCADDQRRQDIGNI